MPSAPEITTGPDNTPQGETPSQPQRGDQASPSCSSAQMVAGSGQGGSRILSAGLLSQHVQTQDMEKSIWAQRGDPGRDQEQRDWR